jgi:hypothetical protein
MRTIKTYRKVGAFYIAWEEDLSTPIRANRPSPSAKPSFRLRDFPGVVKKVGENLSFLLHHQ